MSRLTQGLGSHVTQVWRHVRGHVIRDVASSLFLKTTMCTLHCHRQHTLLFHSFLFSVLFPLLMPTAGVADLKYSVTHVVSAVAMAATTGASRLKQIQMSIFIKTTPFQIDRRDMLGFQNKFFTCSYIQFHRFFSERRKKIQTYYCLIGQLRHERFPKLRIKLQIHRNRC